MVFPGVFLIEAVRQAVLVAASELAGPGTDILEVGSARFLAPLLAGDSLALEALVCPDPEGGLRVEAECRRGDGVRAAQVRLRMGVPEAAGA